MDSVICEAPLPRASWNTCLSITLNCCFPAYAGQLLRAYASPIRSHLAGVLVSHGSRRMPRGSSACEANYVVFKRRSAGPCDESRQSNQSRLKVLRWRIKRRLPPPPHFRYTERTSTRPNATSVIIRGKKSDNAGYLNRIDRAGRTSRRFDVTINPADTGYHPRGSNYAHEAEVEFDGRSQEPKRGF